ncbi:serine/threonine-protein kinase [Actinomadura sp. HBU206391]|uniref:serine/threonine-protein kinase n=1 Tax=Actinomadura sp. HBU206391 TaxID=2731692 RepID=UPI0016505A08|nr:serine/threonine-protein kinase [Actinomadura sp. HBU206391]MBC6460033.1 protein kinase [Actinomadura sp. HBU206391]
MKADLPSGVGPLRLEDPSAIGGYHLLGRLGIGGMGAVYLAIDALEGQMVAIKTLHPALADHPESRLRFRAERDFGRRVSSSYIPPVLDDEMDGPRPYIVTPYIKGLSLEERVGSAGPLPSDTLEAVAIAVAAALVAIHSAGLAHRDLKPANVMLSPDGPKVIDFGIARDLEAADSLTQTGVVMGSPGWIAPERLAGRPGSSASDVFGWGCLVAFAATGRSPFGPGSVAERTEMILSGRPQLTDLDAPWRGLVALALATDPELRPASDGLLQTLLAQRGGVPGPESAAKAVTDLWTVPEPVTHLESPSSPPHRAPAPSDRPSSPSHPPSSPAPPPPRRRATVTAWAITAVSATVAVAVTIAGAADPDSAPGSGGGPAQRPATSSATPAGSAPSSPTATPSNRRVRTAPGPGDAANHPAIRPNSPPSRAKVKKSEGNRGKSNSGKG